MKKEDLLNVEGLSEAQINTIVALSTEELKGFIPKTRFDEVNDTKKQLEETIKQRDSQLDELGKKAKGNEDLEKQIKDLQDINNNTKAEYESKLKDININSAIRSELTGFKYPELIEAKIDKTKLTVGDDGKVFGITDQLTVIKETYKDLVIPIVTGKDPNNNTIIHSGMKNPWSKEHFNLTEQGKIFRENPELAKQLQASI